MNFIGLFYLLLAHYFSGKGFIRLFRLDLKPMVNFCLSLITGVVLLSFVPCILQLTIAHNPITASNVTIGIAVFTVIFSLPLFFPFRRPQFHLFKLPEIYEWPFLLVTAALVVLSVWRCFYFPPFARDMLTGPELLAEYAVRDKTMLSSVFNIDLGLKKITVDGIQQVSLAESNNNNIFKSSYIIGLQIMYKLLVQPFGQLWMSVLYIPFLMLVYQMLVERIHRFLAGLLLFVFVITPDLYAYSYVMLYDYSNMIFFFFGYFYLIKFLNNDKFNYLLWSGTLFGFATFIRGETLILLMFVAPLMLFHYYKKHTPFKTWAIQMIVFFSMSFVFYVITVDVFLVHFVPYKASVGSLLNKNLIDVSEIWRRMQEINDRLVFGKMGEGSYGYFIYFFCIVVFIDLIIRLGWKTPLNREALLFLYGVGVVYFGLSFMGYIIPANTLENTTKRGLFKAMPLILFYMSNSIILQKISLLLSRDRTSKPVVKPVLRTAPRPAPGTAATQSRPAAKSPAKPAQRPPVKGK